ncbi:hypothetical protein [uncultured Brachyspira sp.]|uniref:hypothetical protein n=1 Tax=uncultured Brachyspira sp. TaxID=221953 RepID=UPI0025FF2237|nr:hypothetical protein [uncultured Brachyspira sp.]
MKKIVLLLLSAVLFISCKTGTLVVVPIPNIEITVYPPQTNLERTSSYNFNAYPRLFNNNLGMNSCFYSSNTNNLVKDNFVYLK